MLGNIHPLLKEGKMKQNSRERSVTSSSSSWKWIHVDSEIWHFQRHKNDKTKNEEAQNKILCKNYKTNWQKPNAEESWQQCLWFGKRRTPQKRKTKESIGERQILVFSCVATCACPASHWGPQAAADSFCKSTKTLPPLRNQNKKPLSFTICKFKFWNIKKTRPPPPRPRPRAPGNRPSPPSPPAASLPRSPPGKLGN